MATKGLPEELEGVLQTHSEKTDAITKSFTQQLVATSVPPLIYHYTDDRGLRGILETGRLWFTDIFKLNDPSELNHGIRLALEILARETNKGPREAKAYYEMFAGVFPDNVDTAAHFFVCCFSINGDEIGQWRAYADDGRGYAIGFDAVVLEQAFEKSITPGANLYSTFPVTYDDEKLCGIFEQLVAATIPAISMPRGMNLGDEEISTYLLSISTKLASAFVMSSLYFKHEAYSNEQEYRFLQIYPADKAVPGLKLRTRPHSLVKYTEFNWKSVADTTVSEIICGPASVQGISAQFALDCIREYLPAGGTASIKRSEIPYRSVRR